MPQGFGLISGGFIGKKYDVIVDSYQNPRSIIGVVEKPGKIMIELTEQEADYILEYTGIDILMEHPMDKTPVVFFSRNGNVLDFVTMFSEELNTT